MRQRAANDWYRYLGEPYDTSGVFKDNKRLKMPSLYSNSRNKLKKKFKSSLSKNYQTGGKQTLALVKQSIACMLQKHHSNVFIGNPASSRYKSRVMSTSPESTRVDSQGGINSPKSRNVPSHSPMTPFGAAGKHKLAAYLTKVAPKLKFPNVDAHRRKPKNFKAKPVSSESPVNAGKDNQEV